MGKKRYIDSRKVFNIDDIDLNNPLHMEKCVENWDRLETMGEQYLKIKDLFIELEHRWDHTPLSSRHRNAIDLYLKAGYTQKESGEILGIGTRKVAQYVKEGIDMLASYGELNGRATG